MKPEGDILEKKSETESILLGSATVGLIKTAWLKLRFIPKQSFM
jgi:hypothetical protein